MRRILPEQFQPALQVDVARLTLGIENLISQCEQQQF